MDNNFTSEKLILLLKDIGDRTEFASDDQLCKLIGISEDKYKRILGTKKGNRDFPNTYDPKLYTGAIEYIIDRKAAEHRIVLEKIKRFVDENEIRDEGIDQAFADLKPIRGKTRPDDEQAAECLEKVLGQLERIIALRTYDLPDARPADPICEPAPHAEAPMPAPSLTLTPRLVKALLYDKTPANPEGPLLPGPAPDDRDFLQLVLTPDLIELVETDPASSLERFMAGATPAALATALADRLSTDEGTRCAKMLKKCATLAARLDQAAFFATARFAYRALEQASCNPHNVRSARAAFASLSDGDVARGMLVLFLQASLGENQYHRIRRIMTQPAIVHAAHTV